MSSFCNVNGSLVSPPVSIPLTHYQLTDTAATTGGVVETISITQLFTQHVRMEQLVMHLSAIPATSAFMQLFKLSGVDSKIDTLLRQVDPSAGAENVQDITCVIPFYWEVGDSLLLTYANPDDLDVGAEVMLVEVQ